MKSSNKKKKKISKIQQIINEVQNIDVESETKEEIRQRRVGVAKILAERFLSKHLENSNYTESIKQRALLLLFGKLTQDLPLPQLMKVLDFLDGSAGSDYERFSGIKPGESPIGNLFGSDSSLPNHLGLPISNDPKATKSLYQLSEVLRTAQEILDKPEFSEGSTEVKAENVKTDEENN